jgi:hypothetical protein
LREENVHAEKEMARVVAGGGVKCEKVCRSFLGMSGVRQSV